MAKEKDIQEFLKEMGLEPIEKRAIVVKYAPKNLSEKVADFFTGEFFILQICKEELAFIPVSTSNLELKKAEAKKDGLLTIAKKDIQLVNILEEGFNSIVSIVTEEQLLRLSVQQKELSGFRASGAISLESNFWGTERKSWHIDNLDDTLTDLQALSGSQEQPQTK